MRARTLCPQRAAGLRAAALAAPLLMLLQGCAPRPAPPPAPLAPPPAPAAPPPAPAAPPPPAGPLLAGDPVPLRTLDGRAGQLRDHAARVTVLGFWASFCRPCLAELPYLEALARRHRGDGEVAVLSINVDEPQDVGKAQAAVAPLRLTLPVLRDDEGALRRRLGALLGDAELDRELTLPLLFIVDGAGHLWSETGFPPGLSLPDYLAHKEELLAAARRDALPQRPPRRAGEAPPGALLRLRFPRLSPSEIEAQLPAVRQQLLRMAPALPEAALARLLREAAAAMRRSGEARLRLPR